jgi:hypothetical protein
MYICITMHTNLQGTNERKKGFEKKERERNNRNRNLVMYVNEAQNNIVKQNPPPPLTSWSPSVFPAKYRRKVSKKASILPSK